MTDDPAQRLSDRIRQHSDNETDQTVPPPSQEASVMLPPPTSPPQSHLASMCIQPGSEHDQDTAYTHDVPQNRDELEYSSLSAILYETNLESEGRMLREIGKARVPFDEQYAVVIGKDENSNIRLPEEPRLSRRHGKLYALAKDGKTELYYQDLSSNGSFISGKRLPRGSWVQLVLGDQIGLTLQLDDGIDRYDHTGLPEFVSGEERTLLSINIPKLKKRAPLPVYKYSVHIEKR